MPDLREQFAEALYRRAWPRKQVWVQALPQDREEFLSQADAVLDSFLPEKDTLAEWLYNRFQKYHLGMTPWASLENAEKDYWEHEANAVRRAVARGGFKESE